MKKRVLLRFCVGIMGVGSVFSASVLKADDCASEFGAPGGPADICENGDDYSYDGCNTAIADGNTCSCIVESCDAAHGTSGDYDAYCADEVQLVNGSVSQIWGCEETSITPPPTAPDNRIQNTTNSCGSIIQTDNQAVGERVPVVGTPFDLVYFSSRTLGSPSYQLNIPITGSTVPADLTGVALAISYAGNTYTQTYSTTTNQNYSFAWNGLDSSLNPVQGTVPVQVSLTNTGYWNYPITFNGMP